MTPALYGGFTATAMHGGAPCMAQFPVNERVHLCALIPSFELSTSASRMALPATVSHKDAAYNLSRVALLIKAFETADPQLFSVAMSDRLHQPYREHRGGRPATCTAEGWKDYDACRNCAYTTYQPIPKLGHLFEHHEGQAATCTEDGWTEYDTCKRCDYTTREPIPAPGHALKRHAAHTATCTDDGWNAYETCENCAYTTFKLIPAFGHSYAKQTVEPTCTKDGYTLYTCADCSDTYTTDIVKKLYHWFGEWSPNEDDTHSAHCRRKGCKYVAKLDCQKFEFPLDGESLILCPVCVEVENGERLERIAKASAKLVTGKHPKGELIVRTDGTFLSAAFEYAGQVSEAAAQVKITLPADVLNGRKPVLVSLDGAETALSFEAAGDKLTFTLDFAEAEVPVFLIRLTDEA